ncbi:metallophosphoesterase [Phyllobacterium zundukense]|uniref:Calcineurin-like phosphoesterase domain-containing protein n=1 Tax=Phyllobacterium zundukense TaxID=1867719 RepID=A0A2N9VYC5_9HYPH|nr:metallophosphoesterase [Phyllobacterium zundukense]ATU95082.1 hypothetical protein BLM14_25335 [Phyllobacterium zundukense]PIO44493.1 hypothetical protein B5P45_11465 [Phyllobacterium zundukense]
MIATPGRSVLAARTNASSITTTPSQLADDLPERAPGTAIRLLATGDLLGTIIPLPATYGIGGSVHGVAQLLDQERERGAALWLDSGDLTVGGRLSLWGGNTLDDIASLPIAASAVGNHDLDEGTANLAQSAAQLSFPVLCSDREIGLPGHAVIETEAGAVGVVGITHPKLEAFSSAPGLPSDWLDRIHSNIEALRQAGARWILALLHDGVTWWPFADSFRPIQSRSNYLERVCAPWARSVDVVLSGHTLAAWTGSLHGVPAGQAHAMAGSVLPVDLLEPGGAVVHSPVRVPSVQPPRPTPASIAIQAAGRKVVGHSAKTWLSRPHAQHYLPTLLADAIRSATKADAAFVPSSQLFTQAPIDGTVAALLEGPVTELDIHRLLPFPANDILIVELLPGEFQRLVSYHDENADPANTDADILWWNWARLPAGVSRKVVDPTTVAINSFFLPLFASWLQRDPTTHNAGIDARQAIVEIFQR